MITTEQYELFAERMDSHIATRRIWGWFRDWFLWKFKWTGWCPRCMRHTKWTTSCGKKGEYTRIECECGFGAIYRDGKIYDIFVEDY